LAASIVIKFRLAENLALGYSDFMDEGLRMLFCTKLNLAAFCGAGFGAGALDLSYRAFEGITRLRSCTDVVWVAKGGGLPLVTANPEPYVLNNGVSLDDLRRMGVALFVLNALNGL
jgi:hypothetical protein